MGALFYYALKKQNISFTKTLFAESIPCRNRRFLHSPALLMLRHRPEFRRDLPIMCVSSSSYVNQKEWQQYDTPCLFIKRLFAESIPCNSKGIAPTRLLMLRR